mgnify:FL=1
MRVEAVTCPPRVHSQPRPKIKPRDDIPMTCRCNPPAIPDSSNHIKENPPHLTHQGALVKLLANLLNNGQAFEKKFYRTMTDFLNALCPS